MINNKPTGSIRISFGHYSTKKDGDLVINIIKAHFMSNFDVVEKSVKISSRQKTISALYLYPIKSCAPLKITKVTKDFIWLDLILLKIYPFTYSCLVCAE